MNDEETGELSSYSYQALFFWDQAFINNNNSIYAIYSINAIIVLMLISMLRNRLKLKDSFAIFIQ